MKKQEARLYSMLSPVGMIYVMIVAPVFCLLVIPGNFIIDSLVLILTALALKVENKKNWYKKRILPIFGLGLIADYIASELILPIAYPINFFSQVIIGSAIVSNKPAAVIGIIMGALLIFVFYYFIAFKKDEKSLRLKSSLIFAITTAPYAFWFTVDLIYS